MKLLQILTACLVLGSCGTSAPSGENSETDTATKSDTADALADREPFYCDDIAELTDLEDTSTFSKTNILSFEQIRGCVCIKYQYSGCREGERILAWNGEWNESNRPEVLMRMLVRDAGLCEQLFTDSACFSLKKMKFVGNEVLVFLNTKNNSMLLNYDDPNFEYDD